MWKSIWFWLLALALLILLWLWMARPRVNGRGGAPMNIPLRQNGSTGAAAPGGNTGGGLYDFFSSVVDKIRGDDSSTSIVSGPDMGQYPDFYEEP